VRKLTRFLLLSFVLALVSTAQTFLTRDRSEASQAQSQPIQLAPFEPTPMEVVVRMLALAEIREKDDAVPQPVFSDTVFVIICRTSLAACAQHVLTEVECLSDISSSIEINQLAIPLDYHLCSIDCVGLCIAV